MVCFGANTNTHLTTLHTPVSVLFQKVQGLAFVPVFTRYPNTVNVLTVFEQEEPAFWELNEQ